MTFLDIADHYATLGLHRKCTAEQIRQAYRLLAKQHHPDLHANSAEAAEKTRELNAAYEVLGDPEKRKTYDRELNATERRSHAPTRKSVYKEDVQIRIDEFFRGVRLQVRIHDPANPAGAETYSLEVPPDTAPGTRFKISRDEPIGGTLEVRVKAQPGARFKVRGSDVVTELRISAQRAEQGGDERLPGPDGRMVSVSVPRHCERGTILKIPRAGLPKTHGGRGDFLVKVTYRPEIRITRKGSF